MDGCALRLKGVGVDALNMQWFGAVAAGFQPTPWLLELAKFAARQAPQLGVVGLLWLWWTQPARRIYLFGSLLMCFVATVLAHHLAARIGSPRPFALGLSPSYLQHAARGALPSAHASALFTLAGCWLWVPRLRMAGVLALLLAVFVGWGRVYCGVHFPLDIVAGAALGALLATAYAGAWWRSKIVFMQTGVAQTSQGQTTDALDPAGAQAHAVQ